jgi:hypothetical protein
MASHSIASKTNICDFQILKYGWDSPLVVPFQNCDQQPLASFQNGSHYSKYEFLELLITA